MKHEHHESHRGGSPAGTAIDPVCGMTVKIEGAKHTHRHGTQARITFAVRAVARGSSRIRNATSTPQQRLALRRPKPKPGRKMRSTPAPCIPKSCRWGRAIVRNAG